MYDRVIHELAGAHTVYAYDPPGHGYSQGSPQFPVCIEDLTDHLAAWIINSGLTGTAVFGHSLGGEVMFDLAARYPGLACALIACSPTGIPENPSVAMQVLRFIWDISGEGLGLLVPGFRAYRRCGVRRMLLLANDQVFHDTGPLLQRVDVPVLLLDGLSDPVIQSWTVQEIQASIPSAVVIEIPGGTHALTDSHPKAVARFTMDFLKDTYADKTVKTSR